MARERLVLRCRAVTRRADTEEGPLLVVIDGPAGAGKSTVAKRLAAALDLPRLDTGAIYRTLALVASQRGIRWDDESALASLAQDLPIGFDHVTDDAGSVVERVTHDGQDVSAAIRTPDISQGASKVSALPQVRAALLDLQRALGARGCVAEGRDMGTVVFPHASHKFFLTADLQVRAARRRRDLAMAAPQERSSAPGSAPHETSGRGSEPDSAAAGDQASGVPSVREVAEAMETRDARDRSRAVAPLRPAEDAVVVDSTDLDVDGVVDALLARIRGATSG